MRWVCNGLVWISSANGQILIRGPNWRGDVWWACRRRPRAVAAPRSPRGLRARCPVAEWKQTATTSYRKHERTTVNVHYSGPLQSWKHVAQLAREKYASRAQERTVTLLWFAANRETEWSCSSNSSARPLLCSCRAPRTRDVVPVRCSDEANIKQIAHKRVWILGCCIARILEPGADEWAELDIGTGAGSIVFRWDQSHRLESQKIVVRTKASDQVEGNEIFFTYE